LIRIVRSSAKTADLGQHAHQVVELFDVPGDMAFEKKNQNIRCLGYDAAFHNIHVDAQAHVYEFAGLGEARGVIAQSIDHHQVFAQNLQQSQGKFQSRFLGLPSPERILKKNRREIN
jgi:hypothetical protein